MPSHKKKPADFSALRASIPPNAVALESLSAASPPPNRDFDFFHSIIHRNRVKKYDSFIVAKQDADALWPNYKRKFGSAVSLNTDRGAKNSDAEKAASQNAAIHVMDIGEMMSGPRGRAQGGVSAVLLGKISEELLVFTLKQKVTLLSLEVDYIVSGMLPFSARTVARLLSIRSHGTINVYAIESVLLDGSNTLCSYGIATFVASQEASLLPASAIPYNDPAFGPRDPGPSTSTHSKSYYASSNTPTSIPPFLKPLWTHNGFRPMANLIPGVVPNPMLFESDGFRGGFIWGTQFGTETAREVGPDGPPPQLKPRMEPDLAGLDKRAFTRAWQGVDARAYFAAPEAKRTNYLAGGVTVVKLGKGCGHDEAVSEKVVGCKEKDNKVHTGFLFSVRLFRLIDGIG